MEATIAEAGGQPVPKRFWWLKRISGALALLAAMLVGLRYWAVAVAERRLRSEIDAIRARGEPIFAEDFQDPPASEQEDAGPDLRAAGKLFAIPPQHQRVWDALAWGTYAPADAATIDAILEANREALTAVRRARGKRVVNWGLRIRHPVIEVLLPMIAELRVVDTALAAAAARASASGDDAAAVEFLRDEALIARSLEAQPFLISHLVATGMQERVATKIIAMAPTLKIGAGPQEANERQVRGLIEELLDDGQGPRSGRQWCWQGERMAQMDFVRSLLGQTSSDLVAAVGVGPYNRAVMWWMRPVLQDNSRQLLQLANLDVRAAGAPDWAEASAILAEAGKIGKGEKWDLVKLRPSPARTMVRHYSAMRSRRRAAVELAERMFELKHGRSPASVAELVPEFLKEAPLDPMAGGGMVIDVNGAAAPATRPVNQKNE